MMSRLNRKAGIQNEWITSSAIRSKRTVDDAGNTSSGNSPGSPVMADAAVGIVEPPLPLERDDVDDEVGVGIVVVDRIDGHERHGEQAEHDREGDHDVRDLHRDVVVLLRGQVVWPVVGRLR